MHLIQIRLALVIASLFLTLTTWGQTHTQTIRGSIVDLDSKMPLIGATIAIKSGEQIYGGSTDFDGEFKVEKIPVGRLDIEINYLGYEAVLLNSIMLTSGKELILNIEMQESTKQLNEVVVSAETNREKGKALNEMAVVSARSFSVEETGRYAGSFGDPARMASNYAGVSVGGGTSDIDNEIVIRGSISMLNSNTLSTSDFFTGAFPGEYGNATSGVFDLNLRNGNNEKFEFAAGIGLLGIEASVEGYFSKKSKASFLINYRYSTLGLARAIGLSPVGNILPTYQDLSFKINVPAGKAGTFSLWGIGGDNIAGLIPTKDSSKWVEADDNYGFDAKGRMGVVGLSHRILLTEKSYLKTVVALSATQSSSKGYDLKAQDNYSQHFTDENNFNNYTIRATSSYTHKFNAKHTLKIGATFHHFIFNYNVWEEDTDINQLVKYIDNKGNSQLLQGFASWKYRPHKNWTLNAGVHYTHLLLNNKFSIEPRLSAKWNFAKKHSLSLGAGLHSRAEDISYYFIETTSATGERSFPNKNLELKKSFHAVLGYNFSITKNLHIKVEFYYQYLYNIAIENDTTSTMSTINASSIWDLMYSKGMVSEGLGRNIGMDLTVEKFFADQYYILFTAAAYDSKYQAKNGQWYNTRFNSNYQFTLLGGKEFKVGKKKNNIIGINGKVLLAGGSRYTPINVELSKLEGSAVYYDNQSYTQQNRPYFRFDLGLSYKVNMKKMTHTISIDIQNVANYQNVYSQSYNTKTEKIEEVYQSGILPNLNYKVQL